MTQKELWAFVGAVREANVLLTEAENALYGIFGYGEDQLGRDRRILTASNRVTRAVEILEEIKGQR